MGIHDREYYREGPSFLGRLAGPGKVALWLVGINLVCFLVQTVTATSRNYAGPFTDWLLLDVDAVLHGQVWRLLSYSFLHGGIWHLAGNMLFLFWFGRQVEEELGSREFLLFYLASAVLGAIAYLGVAATGLMAANVLGASGAVTAVLVVAACYNPRQVIYLFFVLPVPIWLFVVGFVALDALSLLSGANTGTATPVHLGGAAFGFLYFRYSWRFTRLFGRVRLPSRSRPRLKLYQEDLDEDRPPARPLVAAPRHDGELLEAQVDDILAKVSRVGMQGLSDHERQVLVRASEAIKRRRG